tara:strand:+ start:48 stop:584 length:537 start_codon:yes stop_codon:yes gene_type:complete
MVWKHNGNEIKVGSSWTDKNGFKHPYNWASSWSDKDKKEWGLTWTDDVDTSFDSRFYWSKGVERKLNDEDATDEKGNKVKDENGNVIVNQGLKTQWIKKTKQRANDLLSQSDWYIIRASDDSSLAIPSEITKKRKSIRDASKTIEDKINACSKLADFIKLFESAKEGENAPIHDFPEE